MINVRTYFSRLKRDYQGVARYHGPLIEVIVPQATYNTKSQNQMYPIL